jgi:hypothetical protein
MNGKKAKLLRGLAGVSLDMPPRYKDVAHTLRNREVRDFAGDVKGRYQTVTKALDACPRHVYKIMKKMYRVRS